MKLFSIALTAALMCFTLPSFAATPLPPFFSAQYSVTLKGIPVGKGTRRFYQQDNHYVFETVTETSGLAALFRGDEITERSIFTLVADKIRPQRYEYHHVGRKKDRHQQIEFDWQAKLARNVVAGDEWEVAITDDTIDNMLYQLVLMQKLAAGEREIAFDIAYKGTVRHYQPSFLGTEEVDTGLGRMEAVKYERVADEGKRRTVLWCAPKLNFLPVKVEHTEKGDTGRLVLDQVEGL